MNGVHYIDHTGRQSGPVTADQLRHLVQHGRLHPDAPVWQPGMRSWVSARTLPGLLSPLSQPAPGRPAPPHAAGPGPTLPSSGGRTGLVVAVAVAGGLALLGLLVVVVCFLGGGG